MFTRGVLEGGRGCEGARDVEMVGEGDALTIFEKIDVTDVPVLPEPVGVVEL